MKRILLSELIKAVNGEFIMGNPHEEFENISIDSRSLQKGDYFFAIKGKNYDGHKYIKNAVEKGARGVVISENDVDFGNPFPSVPSVVRVADTLKALGDFAAFYRRKWNIPLVAVTGSNGKTTTKQMLFSILSKKDITLCNKGNFNNQIGVPLTLLQLSSVHKFAVIELGTSLPGEIKRLGEIAMPDIAIITNIGQSHLEKFKNIEGVFNEKKSIIEFIKDNGCLIANKDDSFLKNLSVKSKVEIITFGSDNSCNVYAQNILMKSDGIYFDLNLFKNSISVRLPVFGKFNVYNALAASAAACKLGFDLETIKEGLEAFQPPEMRMETSTLPSGTVLINDAYNSNPSSVRESINSFVNLFAGKEKIVVLGDMLELGEGSEKMHSELGEFLDSLFLNKIYLYGPMMKNTFSSVKHSSAVYFRNKEELVQALKNHLNENTVILFKASRGMAFEEIIDKINARGRTSSAFTKLYNESRNSKLNENSI